MIFVIAVTTVSLAALQATINVPRDAFRSCMREATSQARSENVKGDDFETYMRTKCSVQLGSLRSAIMAFNLKNGMAKKAAASDADLTIEDYVASPVDHYKFMSGATGATGATRAAGSAGATGDTGPPAQPSEPPKP